MGYRHSREEMLDGAVAAAMADGLSQLSFGRVAKRLGVNDRTVVYYFATKDELVTAVLVATGEHLRGVLADAFTAPAGDHLALARAAWPALARPEVDPVFRLYFEAVGLAAAGREPYRSVSGSLVDAWVAWLAGFLDGSPARRRAEAEATVALIDGLLLVRQLAGAAAANRAATRLGVR